MGFPPSNKKKQEKKDRSQLTRRFCGPALCRITCNPESMLSFQWSQFPKNLLVRETQGMRNGTTPINHPTGGFLSGDHWTSFHFSFPTYRTGKNKSAKKKVHPNPSRSHSEMHSSRPDLLRGVLLARGEEGQEGIALQPRHHRVAHLEGPQVHFV